MFFLYVLCEPEVTTGKGVANERSVSPVGSAEGLFKQKNKLPGAAVGRSPILRKDAVRELHT